MIYVISGVAIDGGLVLMGKRKPGGLRPELWELPGGKLERDGFEGHTGAVIREWKEELGVDVHVIHGPYISRFQLDLEVELDVVLVEVEYRGDPKPLDHTELRWVTPAFAVKHLPCSPGFYLHYADLRRYMQKTGRWSES